MVLVDEKLPLVSLAPWFCFLCREPPVLRSGCPCPQNGLFITKCKPTQLPSSSRVASWPLSQPKGCISISQYLGQELNAEWLMSVTAASGLPNAVLHVWYFMCMPLTLFCFLLLLSPAVLKCFASRSLTFSLREPLMQTFWCILQRKCIPIENIN